MRGMPAWLRLAACALVASACATARTPAAGAPIAREWILQIANGQGEAVLAPERLTPALRSDQGRSYIRARLDEIAKAGPLVGSDSLDVRPAKEPPFKYELKARFANGDRFIRLALQPAENGWQIAYFGVVWFEVKRFKPPPHRVQLRVVRSKEEVSELALRASQGDPVSGPPAVPVERGKGLSIAIFVTGYLPAGSAGHPMEDLRVHVELRDPHGGQVPAGFDDLTIDEANVRTLGVVVPPREVELGFDKTSAAGEWTLKVTAFDGIRKVLAESTMTLLVP